MSVGDECKRECGKYVETVPAPILAAGSIIS
jgi:hypothetical protein